MNIVECLILYICGDYVPFDIRYALVKWVLVAFPSQSRVRVHVCRYTHMHPHLLINIGIFRIDFFHEEKTSG